MTDFEAGAISGLMVAIVAQNISHGIGVYLGKAILWVTKKVKPCRG